MKYRYFRTPSNNRCYRFSESGKGEQSFGPDASWWLSSTFTLEDMFKGEEFWDDIPRPVEYFPDTEKPTTYRYFRKGTGEWKVQTADPESTEGNFYRNAETPWLAASHSLTDLLALGATEVGASEERVPWWAVAIAFDIVTTEGWQTTKTTSVMLNIAQADTEEQAIGAVLADLHQKNPGAVTHAPLVMRVP